MSGRFTYIVCYDICDPKRLRLTYRAMRGFGQHVQYSVFRCELSDAEKARMQTVLGGIINHSEDQVMIVPLGPPGSRYPTSIETVGTPMPRALRHAVII